MVLLIERDCFGRIMKVDEFCDRFNIPFAIPSKHYSVPVFFRIVQSHIGDECVAHEGIALLRIHEKPSRMKHTVNEMWTCHTFTVILVAFSPGYPFSCRGMDSTILKGSLARSHGIAADPSYLASSNACVHYMAMLCGVRKEVHWAGINMPE